MNILPKIINHVRVPPIKCQGIKTKLVSFIAENINWGGNGRWIEPFLGSGVVLFNICPQQALISDKNIHIIQFYKNIQSGQLDELIVRDYLEQHGEILSKKGKDYYYTMREEFNKYGGSLRFLFLNRSCFNGLVRFNSKGGFNVPYNHKPNRFSKSYITKIVNQVSFARKTMKDRDWEFSATNWEEIYKNVSVNDFVYIDPPYIGRNTDYFNSWTENDAKKLACCSKQLPCGFALSMWKENKYRYNKHIDHHWSGFHEKTFSHFYHVGSTESLRNEMIEALIIKPQEEVYAKSNSQIEITI